VDKNSKIVSKCMLDQEKLDLIHNRSLEILKDSGIRFSSPKALAVFKKHGLKVEGEKVYFEESDIMDALKTVPRKFLLNARNTDRNQKIEIGTRLRIPGFGAPFIIDIEGNVQDSTLADAQQFYMLTHMSNCLEINSSIIVQPNDVDSRTSHLDLLLNMMLLSDKPIMASTVSEQAALDSINMARIVWGNLDKQVMIGLINSLSPLQYSKDMSDALMVYAHECQPVVIHSACLMGSTGPITMAGSLILSNAANLAGICLTQLIHPGTPVVYGLGGSPTDLRKGNYVNASPEDVKHILASVDLANYYHLPSRCMGPITDSLSLDYQAGVESTFLSIFSSLSGASIIFQACGIVGSLLYMSYEKFIADMELWRLIGAFEDPIEWTEDALAMDLIKRLGSEGNYLVDDHTLNRCRNEFYIPELGMREGYAQWQEMENREIKARAKHLVEIRLSSYERPYIDSKVLRQLNSYVDERKRNIQDY